MNVKHFEIHWVLKVLYEYTYINFVLTKHTEKFSCFCVCVTLNIK